MLKLISTYYMQERGMNSGWSYMVIYNVRSYRIFRNEIQVRV